MKRWIVFFFSIGVLVFLLFRKGSFGPDIPFEKTVLTVEVSSDGHSEYLDLWMSDDEHAYVFLPSFANPTNTVFRLQTDAEITLDGREISNGMACNGFSLNTEYELVISNRPSVKVKFVQSAGTAVMFINTTPGGMDRVDSDKKHREFCQIFLYSSDGQIDYRTVKIDQIRGRGNWTWEQGKKPYNLYLGDEANLLGMSISSNWALFANAIDETNLRNWSVSKFAGEISPYRGFSQDCEFVDLYLNGEYNGLYLLSEKIEIAEDHLEISADDYLFSLEDAERMDDMHCSFLLNPGSSVEIDNPLPCSDEKMERLKKQLIEMQDAFLSDEMILVGKKQWLDFIDLDSWVRKYLIEEVFLNYDAGAQSQYFFWRSADGRIYSGPCWDYDNILGVPSPGGAQIQPNCFLAQRTWKRASQYTPWYGALWKKEAFSDLVKKYYEDMFLPKLKVLAEELIPAHAEMIRPAAEADRLRWPDLFKNNDSYQDAVEFLLDFLQRRIAFLNSAWIDGDEYCTITLKTRFAQYRFYSVRPGSVCEDLPSPEEFDLQGVTQWRYEDTGKPFESGTVVWEDVKLFADWSR